MGLIKGKASLTQSHHLAVLKDTFSRGSNDFPLGKALLSALRAGTVSPSQTKVSISARANKAMQ